MKLVFMGTPEFAVVTLKALVAAGHDIVAVYSQPPRPAGRGQNLRPSPVHEFAVSKGIEVRTPLSLKSVEEQKSFADLKADAAVVVAYGLILPLPILNAPRLGCFNVHASLLPRWRGAAPIQRAIMAGDKESGVCIMRMEEGLDTGPVCNAGRVAITASTTAGLLHDQLAELGADLMVKTLAEVQISCAEQPVGGVTYAKKIEKAEARIDFSKDAADVRNHIHGLSPFPGAWVNIQDARVKVLACEVVNQTGESGVALDDQLTVVCGNQAIRLLNLQREGKGVMDAATFLRGFPVPKGTRLT
jgi:methionyl-tRNA formyltransferase